MARLGGDEFAILMPCEHAVAAGRLAEAVLDALRAENLDMAGPTIGTSIGIAIYPDNADERTLLLSYADTALYRAKSEGRRPYRFFEATMGAQVRERRLLEHDLRHAVTRGELHLVYQPQNKIASGEVFGFEVLLRWQHPVRGPVSPRFSFPSRRRAPSSCPSANGCCASLPRGGELDQPAHRRGQRLRRADPCAEHSCR